MGSRSRCSSAVEQLFRKQQVVGSNPTTGSLKKSQLDAELKKQPRPGFSVVSSVLPESDPEQAVQVRAADTAFRVFCIHPPEIRETMRIRGENPHVDRENEILTGVSGSRAGEKIRRASVDGLFSPGARRSAARALPASPAPSSEHSSHLSPKAGFARESPRRSRDRPRRASVALPPHRVSRGIGSAAPQPAGRAGGRCG